MRLRLLVIAAALCAAFPTSAAASVEDQIVLERRAGLSVEERADTRADAGVVLEEALPLARTEVVSAAPGERAEALAALRNDPDVVWAEPNHTRRIATADPYWPQLWGLENIGQFVRSAAGAVDADIDAPEAWQLTRGRGVTVAVVDTGASPHPDLTLHAGWDFVDDDGDPADGHGHGTHVAGTIAALENDGGIVGVAPDAQLMPLRVLGDSGSGSSADVAAAFAHAGDRGVRVVNASLGSSSYSHAEYTAIRDHPGTLYVVAAGNAARDNDTQPTYPCAYDLPNVLCVGATDSSDRPASFSNFGDTSVDLHAPGVSTLSTYKNSAYAYMNGTSMATPHAAGAAALVVARAPALDADDLRLVLMDGADPVSALAGLSQTSARLNAAGALGALARDVTPPAAPDGASAVGGAGEVTLEWDDSEEEDIAGYRVYTESGARVAEPGTSRHTLSGLQPGTTVAVRVTAVDRAGNESAPSATVTARTDDPPPPAPEPVAPVALAAPPAALPILPAPAPATGSEPARPTLDGARVAGRIVVCRRGCTERQGRLRFRLGADAAVRVTLARRSCHQGTCRFTTTGHRTITLDAGEQALPVGERLAGLALAAGAWRVTLRTATDSATAPFSIAAR